MQFYVYRYRATSPFSRAAGFLRRQFTDGSSGPGASWRLFTKTILIMKMTILLLTTTFLHAAVNTAAQKITFSGRNISLETIFSVVEKQTGYVVFYDYRNIQRAKPVTVFAKNKPLETFLEECFRAQPFGFAIEDKTIVITSPATTPREVSPTLPPSPPVISFVVPPPVAGRVTDASGNPLAGINIVVKETKIGTTTDTEGNFTITAAEGNTLVVSGVGYESQEIKLSSLSPLVISLKIVEDKLNEVVVVGYGTQRKIDMTGAVGSVGTEMLQKRVNTTNVEQTLSGAVSGVDVSMNSGRPGGTPQIRIRGTTSVSNTNDPLYVVDGVMMNVERMQGGAHVINSLAPNNIESIEVLKDASATAIYGARGANGVILITTKKGRKEGGQVAYHGSASLGRVAKRMDLMNSEEFMRIEDIAYQNAEKFDPNGFARGNYIDPQVKRRNFTPGNPLGNPVLFDDNLNPLYDTDWQDEAFQTAFTQNHNLSLTGGDRKTTYGIYLNYRDEDGVMKYSWLKRYSGRIVLDSKIKDWLTVGGSINYNSQKERVLDGWALRSVYQGIPIIPVKFPDGSWALGQVYPAAEGPNQQRVAAEDKRLFDTKNLLANIYTNISFSKQLSLKTMIGTNQVRQEIDRYAGRDVDWVSQNQGGIASISGLSQQNWQLDNLLNYDAEIGSGHSLKALLGQSLQTYNRISSSAETWGFTDDYYEYNNLGAGNNPRPSTSSFSEYTMLSYFGRVNYVYKGKYLFTATGRVDGASKFGNNNRYAFFPSVAGGWVISQEDFLKGNNVVNYLKLRASYGLTGNSEIANYQYEAGLGTYTTVFNGTRNIGVGINTLSNPLLKWESNAQADLGLELGLLDNRISIEADVYIRKSKDMLLSRPVPRSSGYSVVVENIGNMQNQGFEVSLKTENITRERFRWTTSFNFSKNKNTVLKLHGGADILIGSVPGGAPGSIIREGLPINTFVGYVRLGTWGSHQADEAARYNRRPGDVRYLDVNDDGIINSNDRLPIGNGLPDGYGTLVNTFTYRNFELSVDIQFMYGNDIMWEANQAIEDRTGAYNNMLRTVLNAWTPENQNTFIAQNKPLQGGYDTNNDTYRMKDGSFIRGRNLMLTYFVPNRLFRQAVQGLRFYVAAQNFFIITKYPGYDPEVATPTGDFARGRASYYEYPTARTFTFGANIEF